MINDLKDLQNSPLLAELHLDWTPETVKQLEDLQHTEPAEHGIESYSDYYHKFYGCYFVIEIFKNMIALTLRQRTFDGDLMPVNREIGRFFNPSLIPLMAEAVKDVYNPSVEHAYFPINDKVRDYIKHKLNI